MEVTLGVLTDLLVGGGKDHRADGRQGVGGDHQAGAIQPRQGVTEGLQQRRRRGAGGKDHPALEVLRCQMWQKHWLRLKPILK